jgi:hypothetical protein
MAVTPMWKIRLAIFQGVAGAWLRNIFSSPKARAERYHQAVAEEAFETWMNWGEDFAKVISDRIDAAERDSQHSSVRFWQDVLVSAHDFDSYPENRAQRESMTFHENRDDRVVAA